MGDKFIDFWKLTPKQPNLEYANERLAYWETSLDFLKNKAIEAIYAENYKGAIAYLYEAKKAKAFADALRKRLKK